MKMDMKSFVVGLFFGMAISVWAALFGIFLTGA